MFSSIIFSNMFQHVFFLLVRNKIQSNINEKINGQPGVIQGNLLQRLINLRVDVDCRLWLHQEIFLNFNTHNICTVQCKQTLYEIGSLQHHFCYIPKYGRGGSRTHTTFNGQRILSPSCLPFHHSPKYYRPITTRLPYQLSVEEGEIVEWCLQSHRRWCSCISPERLLFPIPSV